MDKERSSIRVHADIAILGAGLSGLTLNYLLRNSGLKVVVIEARDRIGGRIRTVREEGQPTVEMGATWFGNKHTHLISLMQELGLDGFIQQLGETAIYEYMSTSLPQLVVLPENDDPTFRIKGGSSALTETLAGWLETEKLYLGTAVKQLTENAGGILVQASGLELQAARVVSTLPPNLFLSAVTTHPELPEQLTGLMGATHTWMGESIKFGLTYASPFWRAKGSSGTVFSNTGPVTEMYDHSNFEDTHYALKGFLNGNYYSLSREERLQLILGQLRKYYGNHADQYTHYHECVWAGERYTYAPYERHVLPHQNNGHPLYRNTWMNDKLLLSGSETARNFPGYMDGAIDSAYQAYEILTQ